MSHRAPRRNDSLPLFPSPLRQPRCNAVRCPVEVEGIEFSAELRDVVDLDRAGGCDDQVLSGGSKNGFAAQWVGRFQSSDQFARFGVNQAMDERGIRRNEKSAIGRKYRATGRTVVSRFRQRNFFPRPRIPKRFPLTGGNHEPSAVGAVAQNKFTTE